MLKINYHSSYFVIELSLPNGAADQPPAGGTLACQRLDGFIRLIAVSWQRMARPPRR
jgi:hypothetical protein